MRRFALASALLACLLSGCVTPDPSGRDDSSWRKWESEIQIRLFYDIGITKPGFGGGSVHVYGMQVQNDGSETVVWRHFLFERHAHLFPRRYEFLPLDENRVYLFFPDRGRKDHPAFLELNRKTGEVVREGEFDDTYFGKLRKAHMWYRMQFIDRPVMDDPQPQTTEALKNERQHTTR